jgi:hypothetical protein
MKLRALLIGFFCLYSFLGFGQESDIKNTSEKNVEFVWQSDSRRTFVDKESVGIWGIRAGVLIDDKVGVGLGLYSSNLFGVFGKNVTKDYMDLRETPAISVPSEIGFHYATLYGEYTLINTERLVFTANSQIGLGWVDIDFEEPHLGEINKKENKSLVEHSIKVDVKITDWLRLSPGIGYRYLLGGEQQLRDAFNAPIYILGWSINFGKLFGKK